MSEEIRAQVCPYDCDACHGEDCPCDRLGCAGCVEREEEGSAVSVMWFGDKHGWLTYDQAIAAGLGANEGEVARES